MTMCGRVVVSVWKDGKDVTWYQKFHEFAVSSLLDLIFSLGVLPSAYTRVQSTEVEFKTPSTATSSARETRLTSLENDMASIKDGQNLMMRHLEKFSNSTRIFKGVRQ